VLAVKSQQLAGRLPNESKDLQGRGTTSLRRFLLRYHFATHRFPTLLNATTITARRLHGAVVPSVSLNNGFVIRLVEAHAATLQYLENAREVESSDRAIRKDRLSPVEM
jgi:hypothetical protein